jgi:DNA-binding MarR family transcriptional regulator
MTFFERETGLGVGQWFTLTALGKRDGISQGEMCRVSEVDPARVSRMGRALEKEGLVRRERDPEDRRVVRMYLTGDGRRALERNAGVNESIERRIRSVMSEEEAGELGRLLSLLAEAMKD